MQLRAKTRWLIAGAAVISYASMNMPPELRSIWWAKFAISLLNVGIIAYLGLRQPGEKPNGRRT